MLYVPSMCWSTLVAASWTSTAARYGCRVVLEQAPTATARSYVPSGRRGSTASQPDHGRRQVHWEVVSGSEVVAHTGATPRPSGGAARVAAALPVPPPQVGLALVLQCAHQATPGRPVVSSVSGGVLPSTGGTTVEIVGHNFTPSSVVKFGPALLARSPGPPLSS